jgi:hypothetical protein
VLATVKVRNRHGGSRMAPSVDGFSLHAADETFHRFDVPADRFYEPVEIPEGSGTTGQIGFKTPDSLRDEAFHVRWSARFEEGVVEVMWRP